MFEYSDRAPYIRIYAHCALILRLDTIDTTQQYTIYYWLKRRRFVTTTTSTGLLWLVTARWYDPDSKNTKSVFTRAAQRSSCVNEWYDLCRITSRKQRSAAQLVKACRSAARSSAAQLQIVATSCTSMKKKRSAAQLVKAQRSAKQRSAAATSCN